MHIAMSHFKDNYLRVMNRMAQNPDEPAILTVNGRPMIRLSLLSKEEVLAEFVKTLPPAPWGKDEL